MSAKRFGSLFEREELVDQFVFVVWMFFPSFNEFESPCVTRGTSQVVKSWGLTLVDVVDLSRILCFRNDNLVYSRIEFLLLQFF